MSACNKVLPNIVVATFSLLSAQAALSETWASPVFDNAKGELRLRNFYFNGDYRNTNTPSNIEWGQAFVLDVQSGFTPGPVGLGIDALGMLGVKLDAGGKAGQLNQSRQPGSVFPLERNGQAADEFSSLGLTPKLKFRQSELRYGTLIPKVPVMMANDGRLLPQTFEGTQFTSKDLDNVKFTAGQLTRVKSRMSSNTEKMSIAGANNPTTGRFSDAFTFAGVDVAVGKKLILQYYYGELEDFYRQHFTGAVYETPLAQGTLKADFRYFNSSSQGKNTNDSSYFTTGYYGNGRTKGEVDNELWSGLLLYSWLGHTFGAGYQRSYGDSDFPWINQGDGSSAYLITESQINKFARAGESTWLARYNFDFAAVGLPGLSAGVVYEQGTGIKSQYGDPKEWERDLVLSYVIQSGPFKNLNFSWRNATFRSDVSGARSQDENRLIVGYTVPLF